MWAYAIWDNKLKKLFMSRDRFGVKPVYYMLSNDTFYFASELKSFKYLEKNLQRLIMENFHQCTKILTEKTLF